MLEIIAVLVLVMAAAAAILLPLSWLLGRILVTEPPSILEWVRMMLSVDARPAPVKSITAAAGKSASMILPQSSGLWGLVIRGTLYLLGLVSEAYASAWIYILFVLVGYLLLGR